jgi:hypothetical protein
MSKIRKLPATAWFIIGVVAALAIVPTAAYGAAALKFTGIEGTSGNEADVTAAHQLLTTPASPSQFVSYETFLASAQGATGCDTIGTVPAGDSLIIQNVQADVQQADEPQYISYLDSSDQTAYSQFSSSYFELNYASSFCPVFPTAIVTGEAPAGGVGNVTVPLQPGFVVPSGTDLMATGGGMDAWIYVTGYLVPSADAPVITPQVKSLGHASRLPAHHLLTPVRP